MTSEDRLHELASLGYQGVVRRDDLPRFDGLVDLARVNNTAQDINAAGPQVSPGQPKVVPAIWVQPDHARQDVSRPRFHGNVEGAPLRSVGDEVLHAEVSCVHVVGQHSCDGVCLRRLGVSIPDGNHNGIANCAMNILAAKQQRGGLVDHRPALCAPMLRGFDERVTDVRAVLGKN